MKSRPILFKMKTGNGNIWEDNLIIIFESMSYFGLREMSGPMSLTKLSKQRRNKIS